MNDAQRRILIVDDSADDIRILMENLKQDYAVLAATSGEKALERAGQEPRPDVILLDVAMPGMDGYETCRRLKADESTRDLDVIFVSAHDTPGEKLAGYDAGGDDYLIKPVQPDELRRKVARAIQNRDARQAITDEKKMAMETAMTALTNIGEQGVVLDFMRRSFSVGTLQELANLVAETTMSFGLESSVQIRSARALIHASSSGRVSPLEEELLTRLADAGNIRSSGARLLLNYGHASQLIKNMPEDDSDKCGRLRDHLAIVLESADARLKALEMEHALAQLVKDSNQALQNIQALQGEQKQTAMQIMDDVMKELEASFLSYGLTEDQEETLLKVVQHGIDRSLDNFEKGLQIDEQMYVIINRLKQFS